MTKNVASLYVFLMAHGEVWGIQVVPKVAVADTALLCTVYAAVHYLSNKRLLLNPVVEPIPFKNKGYKALGKSRQPFRTPEGDSVVKIFDTSDTRLSPNIDVMIKCGIKASRTFLSSDKRFVQLSYPYRKGSHNTNSFRKFAGVTTMLHKLHEQGYVHGDMRKENIIFGADEDTTSYLIDFDMAKQEGATYPRV